MDMEVMVRKVFKANAVMCLLKIFIIILIILCYINEKVDTGLSTSSLVGRDGWVYETSPILLFARRLFWFRI